MLEYNISLYRKTILVTGAAGFIGSNLVKRLFHEFNGIKIVGIDSVTDYYDVNIKYARLEEIEALDKDWTFVKASIADKDICIRGKVSAAWSGPTSENMIIRKMKNNALKNFPKDYHNTFVTSMMEDVEENGDIEQTPSQVIDLTADEDSKKEVDNEAMAKKLPSVSDFEETPTPAPKKEDKSVPFDNLLDGEDIPF